VLNKTRQNCLGVEQLTYFSLADSEDSVMDLISLFGLAAKKHEGKISPASSNLCDTSLCVCAKGPQLDLPGYIFLSF
jgi:hypothetical protein